MNRGSYSHLPRILRQALKQLREDGVIVSRRGSGSFLHRRPDGAVLDFAPIGSIADIQRTFEFRTAIEGEAAYLAAKRSTEEDLVQLRTALTELDRCRDEGKLSRSCLNFPTRLIALIANLDFFFSQLVSGERGRNQIREQLNQLPTSASHLAPFSHHRKLFKQVGANFYTVEISHIPFLVRFMQEAAWHGPILANRESGLKVFYLRGRRLAEASQTSFGSCSAQPASALKHPSIALEPGSPA